MIGVLLLVAGILVLAAEFWLCTIMPALALPLIFLTTATMGVVAHQVWEDWRPYR